MTSPHSASLCSAPPPTQKGERKGARRAAGSSSPPSIGGEVVFGANRSGGRILCAIVLPRWTPERIIPPSPETAQIASQHQCVELLHRTILQGCHAPLTIVFSAERAHLGDAISERPLLLPGQSGYGRLSPPPDCRPPLETPAGPPPLAGVFFLGFAHGNTGSGEAMKAQSQEPPPSCFTPRILYRLCLHCG